ncbi:DUF1850 domain-containing protein [Bhargavaea cecembensis]|uniref:DUF1850 domain-containing protein n=1 Tax=Bhargavaea cecembensis TaxID=394098 RepID=UPI00058B2AD2|nr:DUF1850 domain-containing protein [Bhargavaea cecembensis]
MRKFALAAGAGILLLCFLLLPVFTAFTFTETRTEHPAVHYIRKTGEDRFAIRYTHSIHLTDVLESYRVTGDGRIRLLRMEYEDLAIGLPGHAEAGETFTERDGKYILEYEDKTLDSFNLFVADIDADLEFRYDGRRHDLKKELERGASYLFEVKRLSLLGMLKGVNMNGG